MSVKILVFTEFLLEMISLQETIALLQTSLLLLFMQCSFQGLVQIQPNCLSHLQNHISAIHYSSLNFKPYICPAIQVTQLQNHTHDHHYVIQFQNLYTCPALHNTHSKTTILRNIMVIFLYFQSN